MPKFEVPILIDEVEADNKTDAWDMVYDYVQESGLPALVGMYNWSIGEVHEVS